MLTEQKTYHDNGSLKEHYFEDGNGDYFGIYKSFYDNGSISQVGYCENSRYVGVMKWCNRIKGIYYIATFKKQMSYGIKIDFL